MSATSSFFLGPHQGRWTPESWDDLKQTIASGILNETGWVELKAGLPPDKPGGVELAKDLASLALQGGLFVVGVAEVPKSGGVAGEIRGVDLAAARDRIDQIARNVPSPPIYVETRPIPDPDPSAEGRGVLLVGVPASGPHMVDERYWGRGDTGKTPLRDLQVRELLARRRIAEDDVLDQVRALEQVSPRPADSDSPPAPRVYLRIVPQLGRRDSLLPLLQDPNGKQQVLDLLGTIRRQRPDPTEESVLAFANWWAPYAHGRSLSSHDPTMTADQSLTLLRLEDTGAADLVHGSVGGYSSRGWGDPIPTVHTGSILAVVHDALALVGQLADQHAVNPGLWLAAVRVDHLEGCHDWLSVRQGMSHFPASYNGRPDYEDTVTTTTGELVEEPWVVAEKVLARLVRAVGAERRYLPYAPRT